MTSDFRPPNVNEGSQSHDPADATTSQQWLLRNHRNARSKVNKERGMTPDSWAAYGRNGFSEPRGLHVPIQRTLSSLTWYLTFDDNAPLPLLVPWTSFLWATEVLCLVHSPRGEQARRLFQDLGSEVLYYQKFHCIVYRIKFKIHYPQPGCLKTLLEDEDLLPQKKHWPFPGLVLVLHDTLTNCSGQIMQ